MKNIYIPHLQDLGGSRTYRVFGMVDKLTLTLKHFKAAFLAPRQAWQLQEWHLSFKRGRRVRGWEARLLSADCSSCNPTSGFHSLPRIYRALKTTDFYRALFRTPRLDRCSDLYVINVMYGMDLVTKLAFFTCSLKTLGHKLSDELLGSPLTSILSDRRPPEIFLGSITKKCKKIFFWLSGRLLEIFT